jgi:hypothetical protein
MARTFKEGQYVHIPAGVVAYNLSESGDVVSYFKSHEPLALMYLGSRADPKFAGSNMCEVFYEGKVYSIIEENVYEMRGENE